MKFTRYTDKYNIMRLKDHDISLAEFIKCADIEEETLDNESNSRVVEYIKSDPDFISNIKVTIEIDDEGNNRI